VSNVTEVHVASHCRYSACRPQASALAVVPERLTLSRNLMSRRHAFEFRLVVSMDRRVVLNGSGARREPSALRGALLARERPPLTPLEADSSMRP
jgi:hypothetical protein